MGLDYGVVHRQALMADVSCSLVISQETNAKQHAIQGAVSLDVSIGSPYGYYKIVRHPCVHSCHHSFSLLLKTPKIIILVPIVVKFSVGACGVSGVFLKQFMSITILMIVQIFESVLYILREPMEPWNALELYSASF